MKLRKIFKTGILLVCTLFMIVQGKQMIVAEKGGNDSHYTYTITLYTGKEGAFSDGSTEVKITDLEYGQVISLGDYLTNVNLNDADKYYVKGIRESGKDNNTVSTPAFKVECDREYVVAYGIKGDMTKYTVNYQDENGNTLAASQTYYGVVGDKAVVAFHYVDGYRPQAYNLTKTLSKNEAENVLTFTYRRIVQNSNTNTDTSATNNTTTNNQNTNSNVNGNTTNDQTNVDNTTTNDTQENTTVDEDDQTTEDVIDLDEDETPLDNGSKKDQSSNQRPASFMYIMIGLACIAILALIILFVIIKKKDQTKREQKEDENNNDM